MTQRLRDLIDKVILLEGNKGKARLSLATGKSEQMIDRYRKGIHRPPSDVVVQLALACGCTTEDAATMAEESAGAPKRTA